MPQTRFTYRRLSHRLDALIRGRLWLQVILSLVFGISFGLMLGPDLALISRDTAELISKWVALPGKLFLAAIRMVIIPLAASSIILGIAGTGSSDALKSIGRKLLLFILSTTVAASAIGLLLARMARPGGADDVTAEVPATPRLPFVTPDAPEPGSALQDMTRDIPDMITNLIPQNITASLLEQDMLAIVVFSLFVGIAAVIADNRELTRPLVALSQAMLEISMTVIRVAMRFAPLAVFGLMAESMMASGVQTLLDLAVYCAIVLAGLLALLVLYLILAAVFGRIGPGAFLKAVGPVQLLAFSTSSSAAVMPLTMKTAVDKLKTPTSLAGAVIPLASTVNMAGTALYQTVAIVFLADIGGGSLSFGGMAPVMITLTGASIGAPAAPGASIAILSATAASFGIPLEGLPLVLGVDRILDMARTAVNVTGDLVLCRILTPKGDVVSAAEKPDAESSLVSG